MRDRSRDAAMTRRELLGRAARTIAAASAGGLALPGCAPRAAAAPVVKVGILHSQTGTMAISETSLRDVELFAIDEINAAGGVLSHRIQPVVEDPRSRAADLFPKKARQLLERDRVAVVFGCWTSASRKAVLPIFEELGGLLFYPLQYEGAECSPNVVCTGLVPNQQILPALDWLRTPEGGARQRFFLVGSDYVFPRITNQIVKAHLGAEGLQVVGEAYTPLGHEEYEQVVRDLLAAKPDVILNTINGDSNVAFYNELLRQGVDAERLPVLASSVGEDELRSLLPAAVEGHLATWGYFQSIATAENVRFVERFRAEFGPDRVVGDPMVSAYAAVHLWKGAVEKAGSFDPDAVRQALRSGPTFHGPLGPVRVDPRNQHVYRRCRIGRINEERQFDILYESPDWIAPEPFPALVFPDQRCDWTRGGEPSEPPRASDPAGASS